MAKKSKTVAAVRSAPTAAAIEARPALVDQGTVLELKISEIHTDDRNDRFVHNGAAIAELADSMEKRGLLEPVVVGVLGNDCGASGSEKYTLVAGHRRLAAANLLRWETIRAVVRTYETDHDLQLDRAVENMHRLELNPVEEAYAVAGMIESVMGRAEQAEADAALASGTLKIDDASDVRHQAQVRKRAIEIVASQLGKSVTWVNDRAYLSRLSGKARQLVLDGRLPLTYAREICKVADPERRDELAVDFAAAAGLGEQPGDFEDLKFEVGRVLYSLAQVPWDKSVPFAKAPACDACPHNSVNQHKLFDHVAPQDPGNQRGYQGQHKRTTSFKELAAGVCTREVCFKEKSAIANRQISSKSRTLARRIGELPKKERPELTAKKLADAAPTLKVEIPKFLDPNKLVTRVKEEMTRKPTNKTSSGSPAEVKHNAKSAAQEAKEVAARQFEEALRERQMLLEKQVVQLINGDPLRAFALAAVRSLDIWSDLCQDWNDKKAIVESKKPIVTQLIAILTAPTLKGFETVGAISKATKLGAEYDELNVHTDVVDRLAVALGLTPSPRPTLESFLKGSESADQSGVCSKCGCSDDEGCPEGCSWVNDERTLCSSCAETPPAKNGKKNSTKKR